MKTVIIGGVAGRVSAAARLRRLDESAEIILTNLHNGNECSGVIFVCSGSLRLSMMSEEGKDITLYRLHKGDMCMLSASARL